MKICDVYSVGDCVPSDDDFQIADLVYQQSRVFYRDCCPMCLDDVYDFPGVGNGVINV